jgi:hypothetical protein
MTTPVLFVVDDDTGSLATLDGTLRRRYERDPTVADRHSRPDPGPPGESPGPSSRRSGYRAVIPDRRSASTMRRVARVGPGPLP